MVKVLLQKMIEEIEFENLLYNWNFFNLDSFSKNKKLWDYQKNAIKNAIKILWKYYQDFVDYQKEESLDVKNVNQERKRKLFEWYIDNGLEQDLVDIRLGNKGSLRELLTEYYPEINGKISYEHFINRMCFWMATGSGKSLVIIKLIQILSELIKRKEIPPHDILVLTHRDDLIEQLKKHVDEFNHSNETKITLKELREYPYVKRQGRLFGITVFYYRSDNLSDEQKEKIIDFRNYDNDGKWYIFLDEAHKGDKEDSKRQHIYSILSRNGFLFNFSATFTDPRDIITTAFNFNLSRFISEGYGKHIVILKQEIRAFRSNEDYTEEEKQKIVLKSLILLTYVKKFYREIKKIRPDLYHNPLLLVLTKSVNTEDADLKLFFRELEKIGKGNVSDSVFEKALDELWDEFKQSPEFIFEERENLVIDETVFRGITKKDILNHVYNSEANGEIEVLVRPSDRKELAFKLKTSDKPFALVKIGDISGWLKKEFTGYEIQERFEDESYFENLNREDSEVNILMGSRSFYEGWDSNRPNVINFINVGVGVDTKKFILQSVGRGVRIEPMKNKRRRLIRLYNSGEVDGTLFDSVRDKILPLETLFIFGTNRNALETVIQELEKEREKENEHEISLDRNDEVIKDKILLIPVYEEADCLLAEKKTQSKFVISENDFDLFKKFVGDLDDRILLVRYHTEPVKIKLLRESLKNGDVFKLDGRDIKNVDLIVQRFFDYLNVIPKELKEFKKLDDEIRHFKHIKVYFKNIDELNKLKEKIVIMKEYPKKERELYDLYNKISPEEFLEKWEKLKNAWEFEYREKK